MVVVKRVDERIKEIILGFPDSPVAAEFGRRLGQGRLSREENPESHFCVYFAGFDQKAKKVFIGHHKKSGFWLFNGGHLEKGELPEECLAREMGEEWGLKIPLREIGEPKLLTITEIDNPAKQKCRRHFDIWFFVPLTEEGFRPDEAALATEFYVTGWKTVEEAKELAVDPGTLKGIAEFERMFR